MSLPSTLFRSFALTGIGLLAFLPLAHGQTALTDPIGFFTVTATANADTPFSIPMVQPAVFTGLSAGVAANSVSLAAGSLAAGALTYKSSPTQTHSYFLEFTSGNLKGFVYPVTANTDSSVTLDTQGDDLTSVPAYGGAAAGDSVRIHPYWRVRDIFGNPDGTPLIDPWPNATTSGDEILFPNYVSVGTNKAPNRSVYYVANVGWQSSSAGATDPGDTVLPPNEAVIVRRRKTSDLPITTLGAVTTNRSVSFVPGGNGQSANDVYVSLRHPAPVTLNNSGLHDPDQSVSVIRDSASRLVRQDELLAYAAGAQIGQSPSIIYYYLANQGWRQVGSDSTTVGDDVMIQPGTAYVVRKKATSAGVDWKKSANY